MESIGQKLRQTREEKGYTLEQIARDTHIAKRFIEALEEEDFSVFPGDPYLIGFLRTYGSYLGLDGQEMVNLYKNLKLQEQPAPIDELIVRTGPRPVIRIAVLVIVIAGLGVGGYFLFTSGVLSGDAAPAVPEQVAADDDAASEPPTQIPDDAFFLTEELIERSFQHGQAIVVSAGGEDHVLQLQEVGEALTVAVDGRTQQIASGQSAALDLDGDGQPDIQLTLRSVSPDANPSSAVIRLSRDVRVDATTLHTLDTGVVATTDAVGSTTEASRERTTQVIATFAEQEPYFVEVQFRGFTMFRYQVDTEPRQEQYFRGGQNFRVSVNNQFTFWVSNAGVARFRVAGQDLSVGDAGEVTVGMFLWSPAADGDGVQLELVPVY